MRRITVKEENVSFRASSRMGTWRDKSTALQITEDFSVKTDNSDLFFKVWFCKELASSSSFILIPYLSFQKHFRLIIEKSSYSP